MRPFVVPVVPVCSNMARRLGTWHLAPAGADTCDFGATASSAAECEHAVGELAAAAGITLIRSLVTGEAGYAYALGVVGTYTCQDGSWAITDADECEKAANKLGFDYNANNAADEHELKTEYCFEADSSGSLRVADTYASASKFVCASCTDAWGAVPLGCSTQSGGDWAAHLKTGDTSAGCTEQNYQLVCASGAPTATLHPRSQLVPRKRTCCRAYLDTRRRQIR